jgi:hypothetical protein
MREWLLYVGIMAVAFAVLFRDRSLVGVFAGLFISGPLYLGFGYVMAKFGYQRKSMKQLRTEGREKASNKSKKGADSSDQPRGKPPPTKRTGAGNQQRPPKRR